MGALEEGDRLPTARAGRRHHQGRPEHRSRGLPGAGACGARRSASGAGTFVTRPLAEPGSGPEWPLRTALDEWLHQARAEGLGGEEVQALFRASFEAAHPSGPES